MDVVLSFIVIAALLGLLFFVRSRRTSGNVRPDSDKSTAAAKTSVFHAVSIAYAQNACLSARNMEGRRFLSGAAPRLPLPDCDVLECKCRFAHHDDRRRGSDRRNPYLSQFGGAETGSHKKEKREFEERREEPPDSF